VGFAGDRVIAQRQRRGLGGFVDDVRSPGKLFGRQRESVGIVVVGKHHLRILHLELFGVLIRLRAFAKIVGIAPATDPLSIPARVLMRFGIAQKNFHSGRSWTVPGFLSPFTML